MEDEKEKKVESNSFEDIWTFDQIKSDKVWNIKTTSKKIWKSPICSPAAEFIFNSVFIKLIQILIHAPGNQIYLPKQAR